MAKHRAPDSTIPTAAIAAVLVSTSGVGLIAPIVHDEAIAQVTGPMPVIQGEFLVDEETAESTDLSVARQVARSEEKKVVSPAIEEPQAPALTGIAALLQGQSSSGFSGVKPHVARAGHLIQDRFDVTTVHGRAARASGTSDHPGGLALDFMCSRATGDQIAAFVLAHQDVLKVKYVIWRQRINHGNGWSPMEDRGGITANHYDHVHVSFLS